jgi:riboflavin synthase
MFTGLIQQVCPVKGLSKGGATASLAVDIGPLAPQAKLGDSVAINGVCLTVTKLAGSLATFDLSPETLVKSNLAGLTANSRVNVELAMMPADHFGGHFVLGHVDGVAKIKRIDRQNNFATIEFSTPKELLEQMVPLGCVAVDGIALTITSLGPDSFTVALIPRTLEHTTLGQAKIADTVNIETDIIIKAVTQHLTKLSKTKTGLTLDDLKQQGF